MVSSSPDLYIKQSLEVPSHYSSNYLTKMEYHWLLPPQGVVKINVHGATPFIPSMNGNVKSIGMVARNSDEELLKLSLGVILNLSPLDNQLSAIFHGMIRAFEDNYRDHIVETDNHEAFRVLKNFPYEVPMEVASAPQQIMIRLHDLRWACSIVYVYSERKTLATYLARTVARDALICSPFQDLLVVYKSFLALTWGLGLSILNLRTLRSLTMCQTQSILVYPMLIV